MQQKKYRSNKYLKSVRGEPCLICMAPPPSQAHHMRHSEHRGFSQKVGDQFTVPLCWKCHGDCHTRGNESEWWALNGIDGIEWASSNFSKWKEENGS